MVGDESLCVDFIEGVRDDFFSWNQGLIKAKGQVALPQLDPSKLRFDRFGDEYLEESDAKYSHIFNPARTQESQVTYAQQSHLARTQQSHLARTQKSHSPLSPHCHPALAAGPMNATAIANFRAASDMAACYLLFHNKEHQLPNDFSLEELQILESFERIRLILNVASQYRGAMQNILVKIESDIASGFGDMSLVFLKNILFHHLGSKTLETAMDNENNLSKQVNQGILDLEKHIEDQLKFTQAVHQIIEMLRREEESQDKEQEGDKKDQPTDKKQNAIQDPESTNDENIEADETKKIDSELEEGDQQNEPQNEPNVSDFKEEDIDGDEAIKSGGSGSSDEEIQFKNPYKVYSSKFDEVVFPQKMVSKNDLELLRDQLDLKMTKLQGISKKMTLKLKRKLLSKRNAFIENDASRGIFDRKKMTQFVINPDMEDVWVNTKTHEYQDTALTILLDNSGSMRGNPIVMSAMACEIIADILERFSVRTEIIGFSTADWKGGKARKLWESSGREKNPGRLNELRHVIYKHFNQSFKKSRVNLGMMIKEGILKENIDGEALLFARSRLLQQSEKRKILMVLSDGTPVDDSTTSANDSDILTDHLHHVINKIEKSSQIEIVGVGIGHSTADFYRNSIAIKNLDDLGDVMIEKIAALL